MKMPEITYDGSDRKLEKFVQAITTKGHLRASKPKVVKDDFFSGCAAYVWRMVAFQISPKNQHHCMPCTADFDIDLRKPDGRWNGQGVHDYCRLTLDPIVSKIVDLVPKTEWHGITRWGQVFGKIGEPQYTKTEEIVYR